MRAILRGSSTKGEIKWRKAAQRKRERSTQRIRQADQLMGKMHTIKGPFETRAVEISRQPFFYI